ncbi:MAG: type IV secretion system protein [Rickettsiales bacterium]|jgi:hypothetical protein|nr:type IV secretion system protein [Rickettsiales bacterium]
MNYPDNFETPVFPAGKRIAISRFMAIGTLTAFLVIVFLCAVLLWSSRSDRLVPFMISTDNATGEWRALGKSDDGASYSVEYTMQESLAGNFTRDWFRISPTPVVNEIVWRRCDRAACGSDEGLMFGSKQCAIYCNASDEMFSRFFFDVLPGYQRRAEYGDVWSLNDNDMTILPAGQIEPAGGTWTVKSTVSSDATGDFKIVAFVTIARNNSFYPKTLGYYVADFNSYRIDQ